MVDVVTFDNAEASLEKTPKVYENFTYDNEANGGALNKLDEINDKINGLSQAIEDLAGKYEQLMGLYDAFTGFNETMNLNIMSFKSAMNGVKTLHNKLVIELQNQINEAAKADDELLEDVDAATDTMAEVDEETPATEGGAGVAEGAAGAGAAAGETTPTEGGAGGETPIEQPTTGATTGGDGVHTKRQASDAFKSQAGQVTGGHQTYQIVPDSEYTGAAGTISQTEYNTIIAQVAGEGANDASDMFGVATSIFNRRDTGGGYGNTFTEVLQKGYWPWGRTCDAYLPGGKYYATDWGQNKLATAKQVVDQALQGYRNLPSNGYYYSGDGTHNYFSDVL